MAGKCKALVIDASTDLYAGMRRCSRLGDYDGYCFQHRKRITNTRRPQWKDPVTAPHNEPVLVTVYDAIGDDCTVTVAEFGANSWYEITVEGYNEIEYTDKVIGWQHLPEVMEIEDESN